MPTSKELIQQLREHMETLPPFESYPVSIRMEDVESLISTAEECERLREEIKRLEREVERLSKKVQSQDEDITYLQECEGN